MRASVLVDRGAVAGPHRGVEEREELLHAAQPDRRLHGVTDLDFDAVGVGDRVGGPIKVVPDLPRERDGVRGLGAAEDHDIVMAALDRVRGFCKQALRRVPPQWRHRGVTRGDAEPLSEQRSRIGVMPLGDPHHAQAGRAREERRARARVVGRGAHDRRHHVDGFGGVSERGLGRTPIHLRHADDHGHPGIDHPCPHLLMTPACHSPRRWPTGRRSRHRSTRAG